MTRKKRAPGTFGAVETLPSGRHRARYRGPGCIGRADQVDHIISVASGGAPLEPNNAQAICTPCNARKAQAESRAALDQRTSRKH